MELLVQRKESSDIFPTISKEIFLPTFQSPTPILLKGREKKS